DLVVEPPDVTTFSDRDAAPSPATRRLLRSDARVESDVLHSVTACILQLGFNSLRSVRPELPLRLRDAIGPGGGRGVGEDGPAAHRRGKPDPHAGDGHLAIRYTHLEDLRKGLPGRTLLPVAGSLHKQRCSRCGELDDLARDWIPAHVEQLGHDAVVSGSRREVRAERERALSRPVDGRRDRSGRRKRAHSRGDAEPDARILDRQRAAGYPDAQWSRETLPRRSVLAVAGGVEELERSERPELRTAVADDLDRAVTKHLDERQSAVPMA